MIRLKDQNTLKNNWFTMLELMIVVVVIMILTTISAFIYSTVSKNALQKTQVMAFSSMTVEMQVFGAQTAANMIPRNKKITLSHLRKVGSLDQKRVFITDNPKSKILSVFDTMIDVWVSKVSVSSTDAEIESGYKQIYDYEKLTGEFEFYYGKNHEKDGGEPVDTYGLTGANDGTAFVYYYKFIYKNEEGDRSFDYKFVLR
ncbi:MAG: hypothetical protein COA79_03125 [Planctomycetota bacterium]|nr:MAG: hypothetical protein COA79_03125 [Planctomycetota bacterium]